MIKLSQERTKELLAIHGWSGIILGLLLFEVPCTRTRPRLLPHPC